MWIYSALSMPCERVSIRVFFLQKQEPFMFYKIILERVWMVQTEQQYICIHQCLLAVLENKENIVGPQREIHDNDGYEGKFCSDDIYKTLQITNNMVELFKIFKYFFLKGSCYYVFVLIANYRIIILARFKNFKKVKKCGRRNTRLK